MCIRDSLLNQVIVVDTQFTVPKANADMQLICNFSDTSQIVLYQLLLRLCIPSLCQRAKPVSYTHLPCWHTIFRRKV